MIGTRKKALLMGGSVIALLSLVTAGVLIWYYTSDTSSPYKIPKYVSESSLGVYTKAAIATNGPECAAIGSEMLERGGSAVDAAIAALLCEGIASLHSMGLGGGFFMTIYDAKTDTAEFLDARETAPSAAYTEMYGGNASLSLYGGLAVAVPGELLGYWEAHKKYGKLSWKELFEPSIKLCETGNIITRYLADSLKGKEDFIRTEPTLAEILIDDKGKLLGEGDKIKRPLLAKTLRQLADASDPPRLFYNSSITDQMVQEIKDFGGIITKEDFTNYEVKWKKPIEAKIGGMTMYTAPPPGSGVLLAFMMNVLEELVPVEDDRIMWQRIIETFKWAYAKRTELGDPDFEDVDGLLRNLTSQDYANIIRAEIRDDKTFIDPKHYGAVTTNKEVHGTAHISVLAPDGSAVSVTSTINQVLGAKIRSKSTGIIFNDEMDDFSSPNITNGFDLPPSPANFIKPGKRPMSSMTPTIILGEDRKVHLVIGAAGGTKITTAVASIMILNLWNKYNIKEAVDAYRLHHQLFPMQVQNERNFPKDVVNYLWDIGHNITTFSGIGSAVTAVERSHDKIMANSDYRRQGTTAGF